MSTFLTVNQRELISFPFTREGLRSVDAQADPGLDVIIKPTDGKILGTISRTQWIMPHTVAVQKIEKAFEGAKIEAEVSSFNLLRNGARMYIHYRIPSHNFDVQPYAKGAHSDIEPDILYPEVILKNGYDGDTPFGLEWGIYRQICSNGARVLAFGERQTRKILMGDIDVDVIITQMSDFLDKILADLAARITEMIFFVNPAIFTETREWLEPQLSGKLLETFDEMIATEQTVNEWRAFNLVTALITHHVRSYNRRRSMELATARHFKLEGFARR